MKTPLEDLPSLALFAEVVQARSFSEAARRAGLAKSAVSRRVALLEERLGVRLLQRTTRKLSLTADGLRFYAECARLVAAADAAEEAVSSSSRLARGRVRVNAPVTFAQLYLGPPLAAFLERHPEIEIDVGTENRAVDLIEGGFDLVLRVARLGQSSLVTRRLAEDRIVVCASPAYLERHGEPRSPDELVRHHCLRYSLVASADEWRFRGEGGEVAVPVRGRFSSSDGSLLREVAVAGLGLLIVPSFIVAPELRAGRLREVLPDRRRAPIGVHALLPTRKQLALRTRLLLDHLARHFATPRW